MKYVNEIINESGISKVRIAKYLGVSRQMLYNYLAMDKLSDLPKDKCNKLLRLFDVEEEGSIKDIKINNQYIKDLEARLNSGIMETFNRESIADLRGLNKKEQEILTDIFNLLKEKMVEDQSSISYDTMRYLYHFLQTMETNKELKYVLAYFSKSIGVTPPLEFIYDEDDQYTFEGILFSGMTLYLNGGASRNRVSESHRRFEKDIEAKKEEKLSRTEELTMFKDQALNELGYTHINESNAKEVFEKIAEIMSRKVS